MDPALIHESPVNGPGTHVLIVGIGAYPRLIGGVDEDPQVAEGMEQLDAPPVSARRLAEWFLERFDNSERPLASIGLVISDRTPASFAHAKASVPDHVVPQGTADEVEGAIAAWVERASRHRDSLTVFFFCGHGVSSGESILLLRDFGAKPHKRFDGALNVNDFVGAMQTKVPEYQLFLIDACRVPTSIANSVLGKPHVGRSALDPDDLDSRGGVPARQSIHHSASQLTPSYGRLEGASLYTEALTQALDGGGVQSNLGLWVGTLGLQTALAAYLERLAAKERVQQQPELVRNVQFRIHKPRDVRIPLYVTCVPADALKSAKVEARYQGQVQATYDSSDKPLEEWVALLPLREHEVRASFSAATGYRDESFPATVVFPPETPLEITCKPQS